LYIYNDISLDNYINVGKMKVMITGSNFPYEVDFNCNTQYTPRSTAKILSKYIVTMAMHIHDVKEFRKSLDTVKELSIFAANSNRELPKILLPSVVKYGCSFSNDYPDCHNEKNQTENIIFGGYPYDAVDITDEKEISEALSALSKNGVYTVKQLGFRIKLINYPIKFSSITLKRYIKRYVDGTIVTMVNSTMKFKDVIVHTIHPK
jgi:hypothetical protein